MSCEFDLILREFPQYNSCIYPLSTTNLPHSVLEGLI